MEAEERAKFEADIKGKAEKKRKAREPKAKEEVDTVEIARLLAKEKEK